MSYFGTSRDIFGKTKAITDGGNGAFTFDTIEGLRQKLASGNTIFSDPTHPGNQLEQQGLQRLPWFVTANKDYFAVFLGATGLSEGVDTDAGEGAHEETEDDDGYYGELCAAQEKQEEEDDQGQDTLILALLHVIEGTQLAVHYRRGDNVASAVGRALQYNKLDTRHYQELASALFARLLEHRVNYYRHLCYKPPLLVFPVNLEGSVNNLYYYRGGDPYNTVVAFLEHHSLNLHENMGTVEALLQRIQKALSNDRTLLFTLPVRVAADFVTSIEYHEGAGE
jgi:hypothetical protein